MFQKEHLIRILGTRGGMDEEELGRSKKEELWGSRLESFTLDIEAPSFCARIKSRFILQEIRKQQV